MTTVPKYIIDPHKGGGPFWFGMPRKEIEPLMGEEADTVDRRPTGGLTDYFYEQGVQVFYDQKGKAVEAVQFTKRSLAQLVYPPSVRMDLPYKKVLAWVKKQDPAATITHSRFRSDALGIAGEPSNDRADKGMECLLVYPPGYYGK